MAELFNQLLHWVSEHTLWAGIAVFLVAFSESVAIVGLLIPGVVMMFGFGALVATGALEFWPVFWWAVGGAVAGDGLSFWLGRHFQDRLRGLWPFSRHPKTLERGIAFFQKYGGKSVAIGRFFGPVRAVIPLVAGMLGMTPWRFFIANLLSALVWAPAYLLPGVVLGASLELASEVALRLVILLLLLLATLWLTLVLARWVYRLIQPYTSLIVQTLFLWGGERRGMREIAHALADPTHPEAKGLGQLASLLLISTLLFAFMAGALPSHATPGLDTLLHDTLQSLRSPWADELMVHFTRLGDLPVILIFVTGVTALLLLQGDRRAVSYWLAAALFGLLTPVLLKYSLRIPRPEPALEHLEPWGFPSAHVLRTLTVYGFFAVMIARSIQRDWRWLSYGLVAMAVAGIGLSRLYLGVHWLTDVLGSLLLGLAWISGLGIAYHRHTKAETHPLRLTLGAGLLLLVTVSTDAWLHQQTRVAQFQPPPPVVEIETKRWLRGEVVQLPAFRQDLRGRLDHPLTLQFAGDLQQLITKLQVHGWAPAQRLGWNNMLRLLSPSIPLQELPVLPQVHDGRHETLLLEKQIADGGRLILRLWASPYHMDKGQTPLWVGNVSAQRKQTVLNILSYSVTESGFELPLSVLRKDLEGLQLQTPAGSEWPFLIRL